MSFFARQRTFRSSTGSKISLGMSHLRLELDATHHLWSVKTMVDIPLAHVGGAFFDPVVAHDRPWSPAPAASLPGSVVLGTASKYGDLVFWDVHDSDQTLVIELLDDWRTWLIVAVDDPPALMVAINRAVGSNDGDRHTQPDWLSKNYLPEPITGVRGRAASDDRSFGPP